MSMRIRFQFDTGSELGYSIERLSDGLLYDFASAAFVGSPSVPIADLPEDKAPFLGRYVATLSPTPKPQFADGDYVLSIHDKGRSDIVCAQLGVVMHGGDDAYVFPPSTYSIVIQGLTITGNIAPTTGDTKAG